MGFVVVLSAITASWSEPVEISEAENDECISFTFDPATNVVELIEDTLGQCANGRLSALSALDSVNDEIGVSVKIAAEEPTSLFDYGQRRTVRKGLHGYRLHNDPGQKKFTIRLKSTQARTLTRAITEGDLFHFAISFGRSRWVGASFSSRISDADSGATPPASDIVNCTSLTLSACSPAEICEKATHFPTAGIRRWRTSYSSRSFVAEARSRRLDCNVTEIEPVVSPAPSTRCDTGYLAGCTEAQLCERGTYGSPARWYVTGNAARYANEARRKNYSCGVPVSASGCSSADRGFGRAESPLWHASASAACKRDHFERQCKGFGFDEATPQMSQCIAMQQSNSRANARRVVQGALDDWNDEMNNQSRRDPNYRCRDNGFGTIYCDPY